LAAAREVYAAEGLDAPFSAVAKRAGVGQGSLYRHFPNRKALAIAVFDENLVDLESFTAPPDRTIDDLLDRVADQVMAGSAFTHLITADLSDPNVVPLGIRFRRVVMRVLERERALGHVGSHVGIEDVMMATTMMATELARQAPAQRAEVARRAKALFRAAFAPRPAD
jgi:AcrR family transcriptional regulator